MTRSPATTQRINRAFKIAYWDSVQRIYYTTALTAFVHAWAIKILSILIPSAYTVLEFYAVLHRSGPLGYVGTACAQELIAKQISLASRRPCSVRTLQRGIAALRILGLISTRWWTIPDVRINNTGRTHLIRGTGKKQIGEKEWTSLQIKIAVLTDRAIALWDKSTKLHGDRYIPLFPTPAKLADRSPLDQVDKPTMVQVTTSDEDTSTVQDKNHARVVEGTTTRPAARQVATLTLKQRALTTPRSPASPDTPKPTLTNAPKGHCAEAKSKPKSMPKGPSERRTTLPRAQNSWTWDLGRSFLLFELHKALTNFSRREADAIYKRAKFELSRNCTAKWCSVDWSYWIGKWRGCPPRQRTFHMMRDILPLLRKPDPITPNEDGYFKRFVGPGGTGDVLAGNTDPYLKKLKNPAEKVADKTEPIERPINAFLSKFRKFCGDDPTD